jgi:hypothetical protein
MGKARIISQLEPGRYQIELDHGTLTRDARIAEIDFLLQGEELALLEATATIIELKNQLNVKVSALNLLINELNNPPDPDQSSDPEGELLDISERVNAAVVEIEQARMTLDRAERQKSNLIMKGAELRLRKANLEELETDAVIEAWCTDGEPDLVGEVGTAEVPGEPIMPILIKPGFDGGAVYDQARDGQMIERLLMSGAQAYLNAALLPGWQRLKPTYRFGVITAIDRDEGACSIQLDTARSSAQDLPINPSGMIHGVKAKYQDCDMDVFEEGDEVLVEMQSQSWNEPLVVGFKSDPRPCALDFYFMIAGPTAGTAQFSKLGRIKPPAMDNPSVISTSGIWPYNHYMCIHGGELCAWYVAGNYRLVIKGSTKIDIGEGYANGDPAVAATKKYIWSAHWETTGSNSDLGKMVFNQFDGDGNNVRTIVRHNTQDFYYIDVFAACGLYDKVIFVCMNTPVNFPGGWRAQFVLYDDGTMTMSDHPGDWDVPYWGGHGFGDQRLEIHLSTGGTDEIRLYNGVSTTGTTIITPGEVIAGCAMQQNYIVISTGKGKLICYDRKTLEPLSTYQIPQMQGGTVTVDAERMPTAS